MKKFTIAEIVKVILNEKRASSFNRSFVTSEESSEDESDATAFVIRERGVITFINKLADSRNYLTFDSRRQLSNHFLQKEFLPDYVRKNLWLLLTNAHANPSRYPHYYDSLSHGFSHYQNSL